MFAICQDIKDGLWKRSGKRTKEMWKWASLFGFWLSVVPGPRRLHGDDVSCSSQLSSCWSTNLYCRTVNKARQRRAKAILNARYRPRRAVPATLVEPPDSVSTTSPAIPRPMFAVWVPTQGRSHECCKYSEEHKRTWQPHILETLFEA